MKTENIILTIAIILTLGGLAFLIWKLSQPSKSDEQLQNDAVNIVNTGTTTDGTPPPVDTTINVGDRIVASRDMLSWTDNNISIANQIHRFKSGEYVGTVNSISGSGYVVDNFSYKCSSANTYNYDASKSPFYCKRRPTRLWVLKAYTKKG